MSDDCRRDRREFIKSLGRKAALGALLLGTGALVKRPGRPNNKCISDGICGNCDTLRRCGLPQALSARQVLSGE